MSYFWIVLLVFVALSPLISMKPTRRQRQVARLREAAALNGLYVELKTAPGPAQQDRPDQTMAFYGCRRASQDAPAQPALYLREEAAWRASEGHWDAARLAWLAGFPVPVTAVAEDLRWVGVYWDERGEPADVERISSALMGLLGRDS